MKKGKRALGLLLVLLLFIPCISAKAAQFGTDVRVKLSIGSKKSFNFTPVGEFKLKEDSTLNVGNNELEVYAEGGRIAVKIGDETVVARSLTFLSGHYGKTEDYIRLRNSEHGTCTYLGNLTFDIVDGYIRAINTLPLEQYLYGVVPHEMSNSFPIDALKAQAVCARSFALDRCYRYQSRSYDLVDTSKDQVYHGYASKNKRAIAAVDATAGQLLTYEGKVVEAYYSSSNGGQTDTTKNVWDTELPYFIITEDPWDLANDSSIEELSFIPQSFTRETRALMDAQILYRLEQGAADAVGGAAELVSTIAVVPVEPEHGGGSRTFTAVDVSLMVKNGEGAEGQVTITIPFDGISFGSYNNQLGSMSARRTSLRMDGAERGEKAGFAGWNLTSRRYGHGVGMSQRSAQVRARQGVGYGDILAFYYVNTNLSRVVPYSKAPDVTSTAYKIEESGITGISPGTTVNDLLTKLKSTANLSVVGQRGGEKEQKSKLCTGNFLRISFEDGAKYCDLPIIIYGDLDGNGEIEADDAKALQQHLIYNKLLGGAFAKAADVDQSGSVDIKDIVLLIRAANGDHQIKQGGKKA